MTEFISVICLHSERGEVASARTTSPRLAGQTGQPGGSVTNICQKNKYIRLNNQLSVYGFLRECVNFFFVRVCDEFFG